MVYHVDGILTASGVTAVSGTFETALTISGTPVSIIDGLENIVEDATPQLGGHLDVNGNSILSVGGGDIFIQSDRAASLTTANVGLLRVISDGFLDIIADRRVKLNSATDVIALESTVEVTSNAPIRGDQNSDASAPAYSFIQDTDTGMYRKSANALGFGGRGNEILTVTGTTVSTEALRGVGVDGNVTVTGTVGADIGTFETGLTVSGIPVSLSDVEGITDIVQDLTPQLGGDLDANGKNILIADGDKDFPSIRFASDDDTGFYKSAAGEISITTGGSQTARFGLGFTQLFGDILAKVGSRFDPAYTFTGNSTTGLFSKGTSILGITAGTTETLTVSGVGDSTDGVGIDGNLTVTATVNTDKLILTNPGTGADAAIQPTGDPDTGIYFPLANQMILEVGDTDAIALANTGVSFGVNAKFNKLAMLDTNPSISNIVLTFQGDTNTGITQVADGDDSVMFATGGTQAGYFDSAQNLNVTNDIFAGGTVSGTGVKVGGDLTMDSGQILLPDGTNAAPSIMFANSPTTGIYSSAAGNISFTSTGSTLDFKIAGGNTTNFRNFRQFIGTEASPGFQWSGDTDTGLYQLVLGDNSIGFSTSGTAAGHFDANQNLHVTGQVITKASTDGLDIAVGPNDQMGFAMQTAGTINIDIAGGSAGWFDFNKFVYRRMQISATSEASPAITSFFDTNTGIHWPTGGILSLVTGGTETLTVSGAGDSTDGVGIEGNLTVTGTVGAGGRVLVEPHPAGFPTEMGHSFTGHEGSGLVFREDNNIMFMFMEGFQRMQWVTGSTGYTSFQNPVRLWNFGSPNLVGASLSFQNDHDTGLYQDQNGWGTNTGRMGIMSQNVQVAEFNTGGLTVMNDLTVSGVITSSDGTAASPSLIFDGDIETGFHLQGTSDLRVAVNQADTIKFQSGNTTLVRPVTSHSSSSTEAAPNYTHVGDLDTGSYQPADNQWGITTSGVSCAIFDDNQNLHVTNAVLAGDGTATLPAFAFDSDSNTGIYNVANGRIRIVANANAGIEVNSTDVEIFRQLVMKTDGGIASAPALTFAGDQSTGIYQGAGGTVSITTSGTTAATFNVDGDLTTIGQIYADVGSVSNASYSWSGDANTGMYHQAAGQIGLAVDGVISHLFAGSFTQITKPLRLQTSTVASPQFTFLSDPDTGMWQAVSDVGRLNFATQGVNAGYFDDSQNLVVTNDVIAGGTVSGTQHFADQGSRPNPAYTFTDDPDTGMYLDGVGDLRMVLGGVAMMAYQTGAVIPLARVAHNAAGTANDPAYTWNSDRNTGLYQETLGDDGISFTTGGIKAGRFDSNQDFHATNDVRAGGTVSGTGVKVGDGLFTAPAFVFASDTDTGIYKHGENDLGISAAGVRIARFGHDGSSPFFRPFGPVLISDGSATVPHLTFVGEVNTGIFRKGTDQLAFTTGGVEAGFFDPNQSLHVTKEVIASGLQLTNLPTSSGSLLPGQVWKDPVTHHLLVTPD